MRREQVRWCWRGVTCLTKPFVRDGPLYQSTAGVCASGCVGAGGGVQEPACRCRCSSGRIRGWAAVHVPATATARSRESYPRCGSHIHAAGNDESQAPRQRVGDECRRRLMSMLSCAMDSSAAPSVALAAAAERPSDVSAAIVEWGAVRLTTWRPSSVLQCRVRPYSSSKAALTQL